MIVAVMLAVAVGAALYVLAPLRRTGGTAASDGPERTRARLLRARETAYRALRELALDHATGKIGDADYAALRARYEAEALDILRRLGDAAHGGEARGRSAPAAALPRSGRPPGPGRPG